MFGLGKEQSVKQIMDNTLVIDCEGESIPGCDNGLRMGYDPKKVIEIRRAAEETRKGGCSNQVLGGSADLGEAAGRNARQMTDRMVDDHQM